MTNSHKKKLIIGALLIGLVLFLRYLGIGKYVTIAGIKNNRLWLQQMIEYNYWTFVAGFLGIFTLAIAISLPVSVPMSLTGGFFFGAIGGAIYANIAATIGSVISFLVIRHFFGRVLHDRYKDQLRAFNKEFINHGYSYLLSLHFVMIVPLFIPNVLAGLANVSLWTFIWTSSIGLIPGTLVFAFAGKQLMTVNSLREVFSFDILIAIALLFVISLLPHSIRWMRKVKDGVVP